MTTISYLKVRRTANERLYPVREAPITTVACAANLPRPRSADASARTFWMGYRALGPTCSPRLKELEGESLLRRTTPPPPACSAGYELTERG
jgi:hypothetical protein